ncbi:MAG: hypothetical protein KatS3mg077_2523 [Candidatus Binatia bacterium]|nr:MAG: hypothetical protein KatS3mg077_2523 [Candidatus Binatia bacterium]
MAARLGWLFGALLLWATWENLAGRAFAASGPPAQRVPAALLMFPYIEAGAGRDTRVELVNLSGVPIELECFFVNGEDPACNEVGFVLALTPYQPFAWLISEGMSNVLNGTAAPPFWGFGELKCAVVPPEPALELYNTVQGRATVFGLDGTTVSYTAYGFQRFVGGEYTGLLRLDGSEYAQCPDRLLFTALADTPSGNSELILLPCSQDLVLQSPATVTAQLLLTTELGQTVSTSFQVRCYSRRLLSDVADVLQRSLGGSDVVQISVRGVGGPLIGLVIDGIPFGSTFGLAGNEPMFVGGRSATISVPRTR